MKKVVNNQELGKPVWGVLSANETPYQENRSGKSKCYQRLAMIVPTTIRKCMLTSVYSLVR